MAQWSRLDENTYRVIGETTPKIPPGMYDLSVLNGQLFFQRVATRADELLVFPDTVVDEVVQEIEIFWDRCDLFRDHGVPHKRGILLWGPPGSGKSSILRLIADDVIKREGVVLVFDALLAEGAYRSLRSVQPDTPIVFVIEDIDNLLKMHETATLNILDGVEAFERVVFLATTNYPERLEPRVVNRPSRFDRRIKVGHPTVASRLLYLESLIGDTGTEIDVERYARDTRDMSLAHLKELFVATVLIGTPYERALSELRKLHTETASSVYDETPEGHGMTGIGMYR